MDKRNTGRTKPEELEVESPQELTEEQAAAVRGGFGSGGGAGKVQMQDIHFTTQVNKASPKLML